MDVFARVGDVSAQQLRGDEVERVTAASATVRLQSLAERLLRLPLATRLLLLQRAGARVQARRC